MNTMPIRIAAESLPLPRTRMQSERSHPLLRLLVWSLTGLATAGLHVVLFWYFTSAGPVSPAPPPEEGAVMIEMAPAVEQAFSQADAATAQPEEEAQVAPEPVPEEPPPPPEEPLPPVEEAPVKALAPLPPPPKEKPKPQKPREKQPPKPQKPREKQPTPKAAAVRTANAPRSDQRASATSAAAAGASSAASNADWRSQVAAAINRSKRFPPGTMSTGSPVVRLSIAASGAVTSASVVASSGAPELDRAAIETVYRASLPPPPSGAQTLTFRMNFRR